MGGFNMNVTATKKAIIILIQQSLDGIPEGDFVKFKASARWNEKKKERRDQS